MFRMTCTTLLFTTVLASMAQATVLPVGGDASAPAGSLSWSLGQVDRISLTSDQGSTAQGVQQPYEDMGTSITDPRGADDFLLVPNPSDGDAMLYATDLASGVRAWRLADAEGRTVMKGPLRGDRTPIPVSSLAPGAYWLMVQCTDGSRTTLTLLKQ